MSSDERQDVFHDPRGGDEGDEPDEGQHVSEAAKTNVIQEEIVHEPSNILQSSPVGCIVRCADGETCRYAHTGCGGAAAKGDYFVFLGRGYGRYGTYLKIKRHDGGYGFVTPDKVVTT